MGSDHRGVLRRHGEHRQHQHQLRRVADPQGVRGPSEPRRSGPHLRRRRRSAPTRPGRHGVLRAPGSRVRLPPRCREDKVDLASGALDVADARRHRTARPRGLSVPDGSQGFHDRLGWGEHLSAGDRRRPSGPPRCARRGSLRRAEFRDGRGGQSGDPAGGLARRRRRDDGASPLMVRGAAGGLQAAADLRLRQAAAPARKRQTVQARAPRPLLGGSGEPGASDARTGIFPPPSLHRPPRTGRAGDGCHVGVGLAFRPGPGGVWSRSRRDGPPGRPTRYARRRYLTSRRNVPPPAAGRGRRRAAAPSGRQDRNRTRHGVDPHQQRRDPRCAVRHAHVGRTGRSGHRHQPAPAPFLLSGEIRAPPDHQEGAGAHRQRVLHGCPPLPRAKGHRSTRRPRPPWSG